MVNCMKSFKDFYKQYLYENRRILTVVNVILFVFLPLYAGYMQIWSYRMSIQLAITNFIGIVTVLFISLSILVPIYNFRFLYKKNHNELYFSLPIQRKKLFLYVFLSGFISLTFSLIIHSFLVILLFRFHYVNDLIAYIFFLILSMLVFYIISTAISVRSNHIFDTIAIGAGYLILPLALMSSLNFIVYSMIQNTPVLLHLGVNPNEIFFISESVYMKFITPVMMVATCGGYFYSKVLGGSAVFEMGVLIYWVVIAAACFYLAYVSFEKRDVEESQETTKTVLGYPLLVNLFAFCIVCMTDSWFEYVLVFIVYMLAIFFANRKIKMSAKNVVTFVVILIASIGLRFSLQQVDLMKQVEIIPTDADVDIYINISGEDVTQWNDVELMNGIEMHASRKNVETMRAFLEDLLESKDLVFMEDSDLNSYCSINFTSKNMYRYRQFKITKRGIEKLDDFAKENPGIGFEVY